jgi:1-acyl-sn-glycerol-3-phosphate acyltransferase
MDYVVDAHTGKVVVELPRTPSMASVAENAVDGQGKARQIRVERNGAESDREAIQSAVERLRTKTCILFFAEGTRSVDGKLRSFKKGAAVLAIDAQVPLVPVAVAGANEITPKGGLWVRSGRPIVLRVGKPIPTAGLGRDDRDMLTARAHRRPSCWRRKPPRPGDGGHG